MAESVPHPAGRSTDIRIGVVVPSFDQADEILRECLESVVAQTLVGWEAIVVDDGSTHGDAGAVVAGFGDPRIRVVRHDRNRGLGAARNTGYRSTSAGLVALLDADDRLAVTFLAATQRALSASPSAGWAFTDWQCFGGSTDLWAFPDPLPPPCPQHFPFVGPGALVRRDVWEAVGGYTEDQRMGGAEDWDFWLTAAELGMAGVHVPGGFYLHRRAAGQMSVTTSLRNDATNRQLLYRRHAATFDSYVGECPRCPRRGRVRTFLAAGFVNSSKAALTTGDRRRSMTLAARAATISPSRTTFAQLARTLLPRRVVRAAARAGRSLGLRIPGAGVR